MSILLAEHGPGLTVERDLPKLGYKGVESCEVVLDGYRAPRDAVLGGEPGRGFAQMMRGLELGRIQVAARAVGVARAAFEDALRYAQERESFGVPTWRPGWPSCSRRRARCRTRWTPSACTAATATRPSSTSSATSGTHR